MTTTTSGFLADLRAADEEAAVRQAEADKLRADADKLRADAERLRAEAEAAQKVAPQMAWTQTLDVMRQLTSEVADARLAAFAAARDGGDVLSLWLAYRRTRATNKTRWTAYRLELERRVPGHRTPPGMWGPPLTFGEDDSNARPETFEQFLHAAAVQAERDIQADVGTAVWEEIATSR